MADMNFDIFNLDDSQMKINTSVKKTDVYQPKYKDGKDNTYTSVIRFLPNPLNPYTKSTIKKISYWFDVTELELRGYFDCPNTIDKESPINKKYWELFNKGEKGDARAAANAKKIGNRDTKYYSYVLVLKDPQHPELENTIQVFKYPYYIQKLIESQENPQKLEGYEDTDACNVFNPMTGKNFKLVVTKKGEFPNYEGSKFLDKVEPCRLNGKLITDKETGKALSKLLVDCKVKLEEFEYKEWNEDDEEKIMKYLKSLSGGSQKTDDSDIFFDDDKPKKEEKKPVKKQDEVDDLDDLFNDAETTKQNKKDEVVDDFDLDLEEEPKKEEKKPAKKEVKEEKKKVEKKVETTDDFDDLDDFLKDL